MSIIDNLLGGSSNNGSGDNSNVSNAQESSSTHDFGSVISTDPMLHGSLSNLLHSTQNDSGNGDGNNGGGNGYNDSSDFTGLGHGALDFSAPTFVGVSSVNENQNASENHSNSSGDNNGGLLHGLL